MMHISITGCEDVDIGNLQILAPKDSPNTDGIDISNSSHINIHDSNIQTGMIHIKIRVPRRLNK